MLRILTLSLAAVSLCSAAFAAPKTAAKAAEATCEKGVGKKACCKAYVADHCTYVSCCEIGNAGFHTQKDCSKCADHRVKAASHASTACSAKTAAGKKECASSSACAHALASCEDGNRHFFTAATCAPRKKSARAETACCGAAKK